MYLDLFVVQDQSGANSLRHEGCVCRDETVVYRVHAAERSTRCTKCETPACLTELADIQHILQADDRPDWHWITAYLIAKIPAGRLCTYGCLATLVNQELDCNIIARNLADLRRRLYGLLTHATRVPLHRIANQNDLHGHNDSRLTRYYNERLREQEGTYVEDHNPWWCPTEFE